MRTTVTLDADVAAKLRRLTREQGISFKEALNASVRRGIESASETSPYRLKPRKLKARQGIDLDRALHLAAQMEDEETLRKLALRK
jgi:cytidylate kinase